MSEELPEAREGWDELRARLAQMDPGVIAENHRFMRDLGPAGIVRVENPVGPPAEKKHIRGYITALAAISGKTPREMRTILGLRKQDLTGGAFVYRLDQVPKIGTFYPRGYSTLPDGRPLKPGILMDEAGYRRGYGAWQAVLIEALPATLAAILGPDDPWKPGVHPKYRV